MALAGRQKLLAPVKSQLVAAGVLQALLTLLQLAPFVVLVELAQQLLSGADQSRVWNTVTVFVVLLGTGTTLGAALVLWLHVVDMRFSAAVRRRLLDKLARIPLGWFTDRGSGSVKKLIQDDTLSLHYLVTHAVCDAVAAVVAPIAVLIYLFAVDWGYGADPVPADPRLHRHHLDHGVSKRPPRSPRHPVGPSG